MIHAAEQDRPDVRHKRAIFRGRMAGIDWDRLVFLDEMGAHHDLMLAQRGFKFLAPRRPPGAVQGFDHHFHHLVVLVEDASLDR